MQEQADVAPVKMSWHPCSDQTTPILLRPVSHLQRETRARTSQEMQEEAAEIGEVNVVTVAAEAPVQLEDYFV